MLHLAGAAVATRLKKNYEELHPDTPWSDDMMADVTMTITSGIIAGYNTAVRALSGEQEPEQRPSPKLYVPGRRN